MQAGYYWATWRDESIGGPQVVKVIECDYTDSGLDVQVFGEDEGFDINLFNFGPRVKGQDDAA